MEMYYFASVSPNIRELIQARTYEKIICNLMNQSTRIFPNNYTQVLNQSNNEPDFVDEFGNKYDVKLLFENQQCQLIAKGLTHLEDWIKSVLVEIDESSRILFNNKDADITDTLLYNEFLRCFKKIGSDEAAILFMPFPIVIESEQSVFMQFASNILTMTYNAICMNTNRVSIGAYIIYPSALDRKIVLRKLDSYGTEYLPMGEFEKYVIYTAY
jgi:hypothetical protein